MKVSELLEALVGVPKDADVVIWSENTEHLWKPWVSYIHSGDYKQIAVVEICFDNSEKEE